MGHGFNKRDKPPTSVEVCAVFSDIYLWTIETFGPARCMFESNFPVDHFSCDYVTLWNAFKYLTRGCSEDEKNALFFDTAARVYRLDSISRS